MPAFDKFAYSDGRCFNLKQADLAKYPTRMPDPPATLQQREIEYIADFLMARVVGKGPIDRAKWSTAVVEKVTADKAAEALSRYEGTVLKSSLSKEQEKELQEALHGGTPAAAAS